jgi:IstB-like ATP binding protein
VCPGRPTRSAGDPALSRRYERASRIVGDDVDAAAMIDRFVYHAEILALKRDPYRLKDSDLARRPATRTAKTA